jgi:ABC-type amino acid transport system permease subunit
MVMIALCSFLVGAVLGTRLRVKALFPAMMLGLVLVVGVSVTRGSGLLAAISAIGVWVVALQFGYLGGLLTRFCLAASRQPLHRSLRSTTARG